MEESAEETTLERSEAGKKRQVSTELQRRVEDSGEREMGLRVGAAGGAGETGEMQTCLLSVEV